mmetsp:Transcript_23416/g.69493  ORF Transcript_23416/g.69493 Transcript_23416/m.69493 type:complete len:217 (-) Transcript_23416:260-910(-)
MCMCALALARPRSRCEGGKGRGTDCIGFSTPSVCADSAAICRVASPSPATRKPLDGNSRFPPSYLPHNPLPKAVLSLQCRPPHRDDAPPAGGGACPLLNGARGARRLAGVSALRARLCRYRLLGGPPRRLSRRLLLPLCKGNAGLCCPLLCLDARRGAAGHCHCELLSDVLQLLNSRFVPPPLPAQLSPCVLHLLRLCRQLPPLGLDELGGIRCTL